MNHQYLWFENLNPAIQHLILVTGLFRVFAFIHNLLGQKNLYIQAMVVFSTLFGENRRKKKELKKTTSESQQLLSFCPLCVVPSPHIGDISRCKWIPGSCLAWIIYLKKEMMRTHTHTHTHTHSSTSGITSLQSCSRHTSTVACLSHVCPKPDVCVR